MKITVPATSANLGPGFDTLGIAIQLHNEVIIKPSKFHSVSLKGEGGNNPLLKGNNMFLSIFNDFYNNICKTANTFRFEFINKIPISRGLGSSSAVIVSAIAAAYAITDTPLSKEKLLNLSLAYEHHPDNITPAVVGGFIAATVENNEVKYIKKEMPEELFAIAVIPNRSISTNLSRKTLPNKYSKEEAVFNVSHSSLLTAVFLSEKWDMLRLASQDKFHQEHRMRQMPELFEVQKTALENGALMSTLSGSGSTFFNIVHKDDANKIEAKLKEKFPHFKVICTSFDNEGVKYE